MPVLNLFRSTAGITVRGMIDPKELVSTGGPGKPGLTGVIGGGLAQEITEEPAMWQGRAASRAATGSLSFVSVRIREDGRRDHDGSFAQFYSRISLGFNTKIIKKVRMSYYDKNNVY